MSEPKLLDSNGLSHFWTRLKESYWLGDTETFETLPQDLRVGTIVHITDDEEESGFDTGYIVNIAQENNGYLVTRSDGTTLSISPMDVTDFNTLFSEQLNNSDYVSSIHYAVNNGTVTVYFDIETTSDSQILPITNKLPISYSPYSTVTQLVPSAEFNLQNISIENDGQISITSFNKEFNIHTAVTYVAYNTTDGEQDTDQDEETEPEP